MTDITDDITEDLSFQALDDDCRLLKSLLDECLKLEVGEEFLAKVERVRTLAQVKHTYFFPFFFLPFILSVFFAECCQYAGDRCPWGCRLAKSDFKQGAEQYDTQWHVPISKGISTLSKSHGHCRNTPQVKSFSQSNYLNRLFQASSLFLRMRKTRFPGVQSKSCEDVFSRLIQGGCSPDDLFNTVCSQVSFSSFLLAYYFHSLFVNAWMVLGNWDRPDSSSNSDQQKNSSVQASPDLGLYLYFR